MLILAGLFLLGVAAVGIWYSVTRTDYLPRLAIWLVKQSLPIILKRKDPVQEALWRKAMLSGQLWDYHRNRPKDSK